MTKLKTNFNEFCKTQINPFILNEKEAEVYNNYSLYINGVTGLLDTKKGVLIRGVVGCGKTTMLKMAQRYKNGIFNLINVNALVEHVDDEGKVPQKYLSKDWCFDDLGSEDISNRYGKKVEALKLIIELRYDLWKYNGIKTHFTSNLSNEELMERYGPRAYDRLKEMCNVIKYPSNESKRGKSSVIPYNNVYKNDTKSKDEIMKDFENSFIKEYNRCLKSKKNTIKDTYGVLYNLLDRKGFIKLSNDDKIELFEQSKKMIQCENLRNKHERIKYKAFLNGEKNKYHTKAVMKSKEIATKQFIDNAIKNNIKLSFDI